MHERQKRTLPHVTLIGADCVNLPGIQLAADICEKDIAFGAVKILSSVPSADPRVIKIPYIGSKKQYSDFCIKKMSAFVETEFALIFQYDGFILNPAAWTDDYLQYDYIGAPWYHEGPIRVGNGGFSLRSKRLLEWIAQNWRRIGGSIHPEDLWICRNARPFLEAAGMRFAPEEVAARFSKEGNTRSVVWNGEFGFHGITYTDISRWLEKHPEYQKQLTYEFDDFVRLFRKYPVYDGTVHVFRCTPTQMSHYRKLALAEKNYDIRMDSDLREADWGDPAIGHMVAYKRSGVAFKKVPIPAFERKIVKIEHFSSKRALLARYPHAAITPTLGVSIWRRWLVKIFGNIAFPEGQSYTAFWFETPAKTEIFHP